MDNSSDSSPEKPTNPDVKPPSVNKKRKSKGSEGQPASKKLKDGTPKNALMRLNEVRPGLQYVVESVSGPSHAPSFVVSVMLDENQRFIGNGSSKQLAKHDAAHRALASFASPEMMAGLVKEELMDFTEDEGCSNQFEPTRRNGSVKIKTEGNAGISPKSLDKLLSEADKKNPVMLLNEIHPGLEYDVTDGTLSTAPWQRFYATVEVKGTKYEGYGPNKKQAKAAAARDVLSQLYHVRYSGPTNFATSVEDGSSAVSTFPQTVADKIQKAVLTTFSEVMAGSAPEHAKWKVLAGLVMTRGSSMDDVQVVGVSTGTKCVSGEFISVSGSCLNDCHAEVVVRRCLRDFLYTQLELYLEGEGDQSVLEKREKGRGFRLRSDVRFHLYISTAPCGDGRIFSPHEPQGGDAAADRHPNRNSRGVLRTKIESGEGTIPVRPGGAVQTWDGILPGQERLLTMSCSDKIACWNVTGMQGGLLSCFMEPVYLSSVVLGGLYNPEHLQRALFGRIEAHLPAKLPQFFALNKPQMCRVTSAETRHVAKSPGHSVNWTTGLGVAEVVNSTTGRTIAPASGGQSRLCKRAFFQRFINVHDRLPRVEPMPRALAGGELYCAYKAAARSYQEAKRALYTAFADAGLGRWVKKPAEQNQFGLDSADV